MPFAPLPSCRNCFRYPRSGLGPRSSRILVLASWGPPCEVAKAAMNKALAAHPEIEAEIEIELAAFGRYLADLVAF